MNKVKDLRSALDLLASMPGQLIETDVEVDPSAELSGVYRHIGAGGTCARPTKEGPAMIFNNVKGHPRARVAIGVLASRKRVGALLDCDPKDLGKKLWSSVDHPIPPVLTKEPAPLPAAANSWPCCSSKRESPAMKDVSARLRFSLSPLSAN